MTLRIVLAAAVALAVCGDGDLAVPPDSPPLPDSPAGPVVLPTWRLEDVQPQSPRAGQTYGLDTFSGKIIVVTLAEGF